MIDSPIIALHGFLGLPSDWSHLNLANDIIPLDLNHLDPKKGLWEWADQLNSEIAGKFEKPFLMGYSFGARLALHMLIKQPHLWSGAIIVSGHPGLESEIERLIRIEDDKKWAYRLLHDPWDQLMRDWNARLVFSQKGFQFDRLETDFDRVKLSQILVAGSLGNQDNLMPFIEGLSLPVYWMVGENDTKFSAIAKRVKLSHEDSELCVVPHAGHRLPWEEPTVFCEHIRKLRTK
jgi:2-succinyl-6-hydroxy-2,4-cyclohexadiene-1-carboxylate synthase